MMNLARHGHRSFLYCSRPLLLSAGIQVTATPTRQKASSSRTHHRGPSAAQLASATIPSSSSTSSTSTTSLAHDVNPPPSTRPAEITLPDPVARSAATSDKLKRYVALGRAYLRFYKTGLKNVYHNYRASIPLRRSLGLSAYLPTSPPPSTIRSADISRSNFQLIRRAAYDVRRIIPFTLTLIICGEFTPILVLFLGNAITPFTCRIPRQVAKEGAQRSTRKAAALLAHQVAASGSLVPFAVGSEQELDLLAGCYADVGWAEKASAAEVLRACAVLGLARSHEQSVWFGGVYRRRLRRYAEYLALDDGLIREGGGVKYMEADEVRIAVLERGGVDAGNGRPDWEGEREQRRWLERWLQRRCRVNK